MKAHNATHFQYVKHMFWYLQGTIKRGLFMRVFSYNSLVFAYFDIDGLDA